MLFAQKLIAWFLENRRDLPWRNTQDPYKIWISEIILQQTRVVQGYEYYTRFMEAFPTVESLANADEEKVLKLWQGLGYYSRARNLHAAAHAIMENYSGKFPESYHEILKLKGIGRYTAAAVASFAFKEPKPVVDGNVYRFISRLYGIYTPINSTKAYSEFETLLNSLIDKENPDLFNQAVMEFGALHCKPQNPLCQECIFKNDCIAFAEEKQKVLPIKEKQIKIRNRFFYFLVFEMEENGQKQIFLEKRENKDIWKNLYQFPLVEKEKALSAAEIETLVKENLLAMGLKSEEYDFEKAWECKHQLTHQTIYAEFLRVELKKKPTSKLSAEICVPFAEIGNYAIPRLIDLFLKKEKSMYFFQK